MDKLKDRKTDKERQKQVIKKEEKKEGKRKMKIALKDRQPTEELTHRHENTQTDGKERIRDI